MIITTQMNVMNDLDVQAKQIKVDSNCDSHIDFYFPTFVAQAQGQQPREVMNVVTLRRNELIEFLARTKPFTIKETKETLV